MSPECTQVLARSCSLTSRNSTATTPIDNNPDMSGVIKYNNIISNDHHRSRVSITERAYSAIVTDWIHHRTRFQENI